MTALSTEKVTVSANDNDVMSPIVAIEVMTLVVTAEAIVATVVVAIVEMTLVAAAEVTVETTVVAMVKVTVKTTSIATMEISDNETGTGYIIIFKQI